MARKRLDRLTPDQEAQLAGIRDEWIRIGLATERADRPAAEAGVAAAYRAAKLEPPRRTIWIPSPMGGAIAQAIVRDPRVRDGVRDGVRAGVGDGVWAGVWDGVGAGVRAGVGAGVWDGVRAGVGDGVWAGVGAGVGAGVRAGVGDGVWAGVWDVWDGVRAGVRAGVWDGVGAGVRDGVGAGVRAGVGALPPQVREALGYWSRELFAGQHEAAWLSFYDTFTRFGLHDITAPLDGLTAIARNAGWSWFFRNVAVLTERPLAVSVERDRRGVNRLHSETGPAIVYPDGWGIWSVHGVRVPQDVIERPETITVKAIDEEPNAEVRRVMVDQYGRERFLVDGGAVEVGRDDYGILYRRPMPTGDEPLVLVKVVNSTPEPDGTSKDYFLRVHPAFGEKSRDRVAVTMDDWRATVPRTPHAAVASTFRMTPEQYVPQVES